MVAVGVTFRVPDAATAPMPWLIVTLVALVVLQVRTAVWPVAIDVGDAVMDAVGGTGPRAGIAQATPSIPVKPGTAVQPAGGLGTTEALLWYT